MARKVGKPKFVRGRGRPSPAQMLVEAVLYSSALDFQQWQIRNNKIATGKSVNGWRIHIKPIKWYIPPKVEKGEDGYQLTRGGEKIAIAIKGQLRNTQTYVNEMLFGRRAGKQPPRAAILKWMKAKGVQPRYRNADYLIARKIGRDGTNPPHLTQRIKTEMVQANTRVVLRKLTPMITDEATEILFRHMLKDLDQLAKLQKVARSVTIETTLDDKGNRQRKYNLNLDSFLKFIDNRYDFEGTAHTSKTL